MNIPKRSGISSKPTVLSSRNEDNEVTGDAQVNEIEYNNANQTKRNNTGSFITSSGSKRLGSPDKKVNRKSH